MNNLNKLHYEISKVLYSLYNPLIYMNYYGISPDPLDIEETLIKQGFCWGSNGWLSVFTAKEFFDVWHGGTVKPDEHTFAFYKAHYNQCNLSPKSLILLPNIYKAIGSFYCRNNQLISLIGAPETIEGSFFCSENKLSSLEGAPIIIRGSFDCCDNNISTLKADKNPIQSVNAGFSVLKNPLVSLEHSMTITWF